MAHYLHRLHHLRCQKRLSKLRMVGNSIPVLRHNGRFRGSRV